MSTLSAHFFCVHLILRLYSRPFVQSRCSLCLRPPLPPLRLPPPSLFSADSPPICHHAKPLSSPMTPSRSKKGLLNPITCLGSSFIQPHGIAWRGPFRVWGKAHRAPGPFRILLIHSAEGASSTSSSSTSISSPRLLPSSPFPLLLNVPRSRLLPNPPSVKLYTPSPLSEKSAASVIQAVSISNCLSLALLASL